MGGLVGFDHASGQVPEGFVDRVDQEHAPLFVTEQNLGGHTFASLEAIALGQLLTPCLGVAYVQGLLSFHIIAHVLPVQRRGVVEPPRPSSPPPAATPYRPREPFDTGRVSPSQHEGESRPRRTPSPPLSLRPGQPPRQ